MQMNDRDTTIKQIRAALQRRSGKQWSVTGGRGTAWGWITIDAPPSRRTWENRLKPGPWTGASEEYIEVDSGTPGGHMSPADRKELGELLGLGEPAHFQGVSIPSSSKHYAEYVARAEGRPAVQAEAYWD